jgi:hypothetical protein
VPLQPLLFLAISAICFVLAFTAEAFYHRLTGEEIPIRTGRLMLIAVSIVFLALAIRDLLAS